MSIFHFRLRADRELGEEPGLGAVRHQLGLVGRLAVPPLFDPRSGRPRHPPHVPLRTGLAVSEHLAHVHLCGSRDMFKNIKKKMLLTFTCSVQEPCSRKHVVLFHIKIHVQEHQREEACSCSLVQIKSHVQEQQEEDEMLPKSSQSETGGRNRAAASAHRRSCSSTCVKTTCFCFAPITHSAPSWAEGDKFKLEAEK